MLSLFHIGNPCGERESFRFAEVLVRCLCFPFSPYVVHVVSESHFEPGTWAVTIYIKMLRLHIAPDPYTLYYPDRS